MKTKYSILCCFLLYILLSTKSGYSQTITADDGNWSERYVTLTNTSQAALMVRVGDIDNLNFGWPSGFNPFSGNNTPTHAYPWNVNVDDPAGTDRMLVITSYNGTPPHGKDGYTGTTYRPANSVTPITLTYNLNGLTVDQVTMQIFFDDFQASVWGAAYIVTIDNVRVPFLENIINSLVQTGPIGKMITVNIPGEYLYLFNDGEVNIKFDDLTTGAGDGYAIDFVKLLINKTELGQYAKISGKITKTGSTVGLDSVKVVANGLRETLTTADGAYSLDSLPPGIVNIRVNKPGYGSQSKYLTIPANATGTLNFDLQTPAPFIVQKMPEISSVLENMTSPISVSFNEEMDSTSFNNSTIILSDRLKTLPGKLTRLTNGFIFQPDSAFVESMTYTVTVTSGIKNKAGINLEQDYVWSFKTKSAPNDVPAVIGNSGINIFPNPFSDYITFSYNLNSPSNLNIEIYNFMGKKIKNVEIKSDQSGNRSLTITTADLPAGIYFLKSKIEGKDSFTKMILNR